MTHKACQRVKERPVVQHGYQQISRSSQNTMACVDLNTLQTNGKMRLEIGLKTHMVAISKGTERLRAS